MTALAVLSALDYAQQELAEGVREATGHNDGVPAERYNEGEQKAWCAAFVAWCFEQTGSPLPGKPYMLPSVAYMEEQLSAAKAGVDEPGPGDIVCFSWRMGSDRGPGRHVGLVESINDDRLTAIEGNVQNRVLRREHALDRPAITGFYRWPLPDAPL